MGQGKILRPHEELHLRPSDLRSDALVCLFFLFCLFFSRGDEKERAGSLTTGLTNDSPFN